MIEDLVVDKLIELNYHISFAESLTGGMLASTIINVPNASFVLDESYVTYSNKSKESILNVSSETIKIYGVVSKEVVLEMVNGLFLRTNADVCISTSGIAGPTGGSINLPVGTVCFGLKIKDLIKTYEVIFSGSRNEIRLLSTNFILNKLLELLNG